ncbi:MAG TPA: nucleotidyltransferase family protein [Candidatus Dormibacteraeota bacterium]|nr:nucleotidyltransferase family protein [Candidatus Dormibacteraeota bacterium]
MRRLGAQGRDTRRLIAGILLAAGRSTRFGRQKLLEPWDGEPLVRRAARTFLNAGVAPLIAVVSDDSRFAEALAGLPVSMYENPEPDRGISSSIAIGVRALPETTDAALIGVGDQPYLTAEAIEELVRAFEPGRIIVPRFGDHRGNPPVFDRRFFPDLLALDGDEGGQRVITAYPDSVTEVPLSARLGDDIDRPEEWPR